MTTAVERFLEDRGIEASAEGGNNSFLVKTGDLKLRVTLQERDGVVVARIAAPRRVARSDVPKAVLLCNHWNQQSLMPRAIVVMPRGDADADAAVLLDGTLVAGDDDEPPVGRFVDGLLQGARRFWAGVAIQDVTTPIASGT